MQGAEIKRILKRLLFPGTPMAILLPMVCAALLISIFHLKMYDTPAAYVVYALSTYALAIATAQAVRAFRTGKRLLENASIYQRYRTDANFHAELSIRISLLITLFYCAVKSVAGALYSSPWLGSMAAYYIILASVRWLLLRRVRRDAPDRRLYRLCGALLLALTAALGAMSFYVICRGQVIRYPGFMIYAAAGFTFYSLITAVLNLIRCRKVCNPVHTAGRVFSLASALVSLFFLQVSMLSVFGSGATWQQTINVATGAGVFLFIGGMAATMIAAGR